MNTTSLCRISSIVFLLFSTSYGQVISVDPGVSGQPDTYRSIQEAIDIAKDNDEIIIKKGIYEENLVITKPFSLRGEPGEVVILTGNPNSTSRTLCTVNQVTGCTLENLVFNPRNNKPGEGVVVSLNGGIVTLKNCTVENAVSEALVCSGGCKATIENCVFQNATRTGVWVTQDQSSAKFIRCLFSKNPEYGLYLFEGATAEISNCRFEENGIGLLVSGQSVHVTVQDSAFTNHSRFGVYVKSQASGEFRTCEVNSNRQGIHGQNARTMLLAGNHAQQNKEQGVFLYEVETSTLTQNICENNGFNGIQVQRGKQSTLSENQCIQNQQNGLSLMGRNLTITATGNLARENKWQGIYAGPAVLGNLVGNKSVRNSYNGISLDNSDMSCRENLCQGNLYSGICAENGAMGVLQKNICRDNQAYGIAVWDAFSMPVCSENLCEGNQKGGFFIDEPPFGRVREMLYQGEYDQLDRIAAKLIHDEIRDKEGVWQLTWFHRYLTGFWTNRSVESRQTVMSAAEKWIAQNPKSQTPASVLASMYCNIGWDARGSGYADTVTEEGWKVFRENLNKGLAILKQAENREMKDPEFYCTGLLIGRGLEKSADWMQNTFDQGLDVKWDYQDLYKAIAEYLLPRWQGSLREVRAFANAAIQPTQEGRSHILYPYIAAWVYGRETSEVFMKYQLDYQNIKLGSEQLLALYPDSANNANRLCVFACMYKDKETARKLFPKVEEKFIPEIWKDDRNYCIDCRTWAFSEDKPTEP